MTPAFPHDLGVRAALLLWFVAGTTLGASLRAADTWQEVFGFEGPPVAVCFTDEPLPPSGYGYIPERAPRYGVLGQFDAAPVQEAFLETLVPADPSLRFTRPLKGRIHLRTREGGWVSRAMVATEGNEGVALAPVDAQGHAGAVPAQAWSLPNTFLQQLFVQAPTMLHFAGPTETPEGGDPVDGRRYGPGDYVLTGETLFEGGPYLDRFNALPEERRTICVVSEDTAGGNDPTATFALELVEPVYGQGPLRVEGEPFDLAAQRLFLWVPPSAASRAPNGVVVFISAGDALSEPSPDWKRVLDARRLVYLSFAGGGNRAHMTKRWRLAQEARNFATRHFAIDPGKVWVSGFSGGGRTCSGLLAKFPLAFAGAIHFSGVSALTTGIPDPENPGQRTLDFEPLPGSFEATKQGVRFVLVTGSRDFNLTDTRNVFGWMEGEGMQAHLIEVEGLGHQLPKSPTVFEEALDFLDAGSTAEAPELGERERKILTAIQEKMTQDVHMSRFWSKRLWDEYPAIRTHPEFLEALEKLERWLPWETTSP